MKPCNALKLVWSYKLNQVMQESNFMPVEDSKSADQSCSLIIQFLIAPVNGQVGLDLTG